MRSLLLVDHSINATLRYITIVVESLYGGVSNDVMNDIIRLNDCSRGKNLLYIYNIINNINNIINNIIRLNDCSRGKNLFCFPRVSNI